ncbi:hypothetical protein RJZ56_001435 [Blastomyces dermatitidis]
MVIASSTPKLIAAGGLAVVATFLARFLMRGFSIRRRFYRMKASGIVAHHLALFTIPRPSPIDEELERRVTKRRSSLVFHDEDSPKLGEILPRREKLSAIDLFIWMVWPFMAQPIITVIDPELCSQLTQETPQPRHPMFGWALTPVTDGIDLISMNMADHEVWRSRLNPGFSSRNVIQNMPTVLEEVSIFAQKLKDADADSLEWGSMFTLYDGAVALTFDVISRFAL